ncbi:MAG: HYR domain-containing protein, partial [Proteobacteria bacterium]|nr:HYR domain-containing protein [Verrucomicrobiota bacterium]NBU11834.1 HYR domain-containing protein [Pseudomonadota bacterium]
MWTVTDVNGNTNSCSQTVIVTDTELPVIICGPSQTQMVDAGLCNALVIVSGPITSDNCGVDFTLNDYTGTSDASGIYPVGTTTVTWFVSDVNGNVNTCTQSITVTDNELPIIVCPADSSLSAL